MGDNRMNKIDARSKSVRELLDGVKYGIDYYQREYKWTTKQITELLEDLEAKFFDSYREEHSRSRVEGYTHYFLGSLVISSRNGQKNPSFLDYVKRSRLPFHSHPTFKKADLDARQELYRLICEEIWSPSRFDRELD